MACLALALMGNLLVPQVWITYSPCCYDENGKLIRHCGMEAGSRFNIRAPMPCCDPQITHFRAAPASAFVDAGRHPGVEQSATVLATALDLPPAAWLEGLSAEALARATGPPGSPDLLMQSSRLNI